jgi:hypothetical protein
MAENLYLHLTLEETNLLLEALGQMPYIQVHQLIAKIQQQASEQLEEAKRKTENQNTQQQS